MQAYLFADFHTILSLLSEIEGIRLILSTVYVSIIIWKLDFVKATEKRIACLTGYDDFSFLNIPFGERKN